MVRKTKEMNMETLMEGIKIAKLGKVVFGSKCSTEAKCIGSGPLLSTEHMLVVWLHPT